MSSRQLNIRHTGRRYLHLALVVVFLTSVFGSGISTDKALAQESESKYKPVIQAAGQPTLIYPFDSGMDWKISQGYNTQYHGGALDPALGANQYALDFVANNGQTVNKIVRSSAAGEIWVKQNSGNEIHLLIRHDNGQYYTEYAHLGTSNVNIGQTVVKGQQIGTVGNQNHIHFSFVKWIAQNLPSHTYLPYGKSNWQPIPQIIEGKNFTSNGSYNQWVNTIVQSGIPISCPFAPGQGDTTRPWLFQEAYDRNGGMGNLSCAEGEVHPWGSSGMKIQDFGPTASFGDIAIIQDEGHDTPNPGTIPAYVVHGAIWDTYLSTGGDYGWMGPPTSDEYLNSGSNPQSSFRSGYITWSGSSWQAYPWPSSGTGWRVEFRNGNNFKAGSSYVLYRSIGSSPKLSYTWGSNSPSSGTYGVFNDYFSMKAISSPTFEAKTYVFQVQGDDGVKLYVNGSTIINEWHSSSNGNYTAEYKFPSRKAYQIILDYYEITGNAFVSIAWWIK